MNQHNDIWERISVGSVVTILAAVLVLSILQVV